MTKAKLALSVWYGFLWGLKAPWMAYNAVKPHSQTAGAILGLLVVLVWPVAFVVGMAKAIIQHFLSDDLLS